MNRCRRHAILAPLLAVLALLLGLTGSASAAFNHAAAKTQYSDFLLWESEASGLDPSAIPAGTGDFAGGCYDFAPGRPPWTYYDPHGLFEWKETAATFGQNVYSVAELGQSLVGSVVEIGTGGLVGKGMNARRGEIMTGMLNGAVENTGTLIGAAHQAASGDLSGAAQTVAGTLGETPEEVLGNVLFMGATYGMGRYLSDGSTPRSQRQTKAEADIMVEDAWTTIDSKGNVLKTDIQVRSVDDPSLLVTRGRGEGSHGALAESAGLTDNFGLYGTTTTSVNGKVNEVMIGSDAFEKLPKKVLQQQREIIAKQHDIPVEKVYMNKKSVADDE